MGLILKEWVDIQIDIVALMILQFFNTLKVDGKTKDSKIYKE
jgi:hypothetical protein